MTIILPEPVVRFLGELRASPHYRDIADAAAQAFCTLDIEADGNPHALALFEGFVWIASQPRTVDEKVAVMTRLLARKGRVHIPSLRAFCGW